MKNKRRLMLLVYWLPIVIGLLRILITFSILLWNPMNMIFRFMQIIPVIIYLVILFMYLKLFMDNDPIVTLIAPSLVHFLIIFGFKRIISIVPFLPLIIIDIAFLIAKGLKAVAFPFVVEGDEDIEDEFELLGEE